MPQPPHRSRSTLLTIAILWVIFYASFTLFTPPLLDDADSVHAEVAREMLLRHDPVTLYANGIRYLEKAPLLYWSMAAAMRTSQLLGFTTPDALAAAARLPLAFTILALALLVEAFARRAFLSQRAGLYAALITLSSFGIFIFTRITIPDAMVCLWTTLALYAFWRTEELPLTNAVISTEAHHHNAVISTEAQRSGEIPAFPKPASNARVTHSSRIFSRDEWGTSTARPWAYTFAIACALNVLTKGLIGIVFPLGIVLLYLLLTRGPRATPTRLNQLHPLTTALVFLAIAAPWHIAAGLANPTQGHPTPFHFVAGHWQVPLPTDGNVRGWFWFYFMNEHLLRYLNLRIPHDYDTAPLYLFWGLCLIWLMPWSAFVFSAVADPLKRLRQLRRSSNPPSANGATLYQPGAQPQGANGVEEKRAEGPLYRTTARAETLLLLWATFVLLFFSLSTRQEYYVLPALPALALLIASWLTTSQHTSKTVISTEAPPTNVISTEAQRSGEIPAFATAHPRNSALRTTTVLLTLGTLFALAATFFLLHTQSPAPNTDLAQLLAQNPGDYALSMGHFLDLNAQALGLFRLPLALAALSLFLGPLASLILRKRNQPHAATLALAAGAFGFFLAAHLGLQTFSPVLTSAQLAKAIAPQVHPEDLIIIHGEYEAGSTLGFYLQRPIFDSRIQFLYSHPNTPEFIHILEGRSSNLWYGSFFPDAPAIFETPATLAQKWPGPQRIFLWQATTSSDAPQQLPALPGPIYILATGGGKEILSNQPNR